MNAVNRAIAVIKPKQPFADWVNSHQAEDEYPYELGFFRVDCKAYLINDIMFEGDGAIAVRHFYSLFFEDQLNSWHADEERWPVQRDYATFVQWFDVEIHSIVVDLGSEPLAVEEL